MAPTDNHSASRFNFTRTRLEGVAPPTDRDRRYVYDAKLPGLACCVTSKGKRTFYVYRRINGRPQRIRLGGVEELRVDDARKAAADIMGQVARGGSPHEDRRKRKREPTLGEVWQHYLEQHAKPHKRSWPDDVQRYDRYLAKLAARPVTSIKRADIAQVHRDIGRDKPGAANRVLSLASKLFNHARDFFDVEQMNPCSGIKRFPERSRERFLDADELKRLFAALDAHDNQKMADFFRLALLTGARRGNLCSMAWDDVNLDRKTWTIPAEQAKGGESMTLPLSQAAVNVLKRRRMDAAGSAWVFPSWGSTGHVTEVKVAWDRICERANLKDMKVHDLRRTLGSWQAAGGSSLQVIGKSLGHRSQQATAIYSRLNIDPVRQSVDAANDAMLAAAGVDGEDE